MMRHRDRIRMALNHETPDRCPMYVSFTPEFARWLRKDMYSKGKAVQPSQVGSYNYDLERALGEDMLMTTVGWANCYYQAEVDYTDEWGIGWHPEPYDTPYGTGHYTEMILHPLAADEAIEDYVPPDPNRPELYAESERVIREFKDEYWMVGATVTTIFECAWGLRGYEKLLTDLVLRPKLAERILDIPYHYHLTAAKKLVELGVDMIWIGDDVGAQRGMLISPSHWRKYLKPRMETYIASLKAINPDLKIAYHSDGNIMPIIPELIEIGLDILNPIQPACMDPAILKDVFGDRLCFWGSIDVQHTLPYGTPEEVRREVLLRLETIGRHGGLIIGPTHHVQLDTPPENFWAMIDTIQNTTYSSLA
jgi:uroporphyrinogen-III decarboxylase